MAKKKVKENPANEEIKEQSAENVIKEDQESEVKTEMTPEEKIAELNDRFLRLYAEFENFRKRTNTEKVQLISTANSSLMKDILPILDDFDRAIESNKTLEDVRVVKDGFSLIYNKFKSTLESKGLKPMEAKGQDFDSEIHEAIANIPAPDKKMVGKVIDDVEKGYYLNEKVIRYAKVVVGQ